MEKAFIDLLKCTPTSKSVLTHIDTKNPFFIEVDALDFSLESVLSQLGGEG